MRFGRELTRKRSFFQQECPYMNCLDSEMGYERARELALGCGRERIMYHLVVLRACEYVDGLGYEMVRSLQELMPGVERERTMSHLFLLRAREYGDGLGYEMARSLQELLAGVERERTTNHFGILRQCEYTDGSGYEVDYQMVLSLHELTLDIEREWTTHPTGRPRCRGFAALGICHSRRFLGGGAPLRMSHRRAPRQSNRDRCGSCGRAATG